MLLVVCAVKSFNRIKIVHLYSTFRLCPPLSPIPLCIHVYYIHACTFIHVTEAHGATDVTGFGILGHAQNLVSCQKNSVNFSLHTLPSMF